MQTDLSCTWSKAVGLCRGSNFRLMSRNKCLFASQYSYNDILKVQTTENNSFGDNSSNRTKRGRFASMDNSTRSRLGMHVNRYVYYVHLSTIIMLLH